MLVDDEPPFLEELKRIINQYGNSCVVVGEAYSGRMALEMIPQLNPDIVFTDVRMPVMDGIEFAKAVHERYDDIHIVIISGYSLFDYAREAFRANVYDYLLKPIQVDIVYEILERLVAKIKNERYLRLGRFLENLIFSKNTMELDISELNFNSYCIVFINSPMYSDTLEKFNLPNGDPQTDKMISLLRGCIHKNEELWQFVSKKVGKIIIFGFESYREGRIKNICKDIQVFFEKINLPVTIGLSGIIQDVRNIRKMYVKLAEFFNRCIIIGKSQVIDLGILSDNFKEQGSAFLSTFEEISITHLITDKKWTDFKNALVKLFSQWEAENRHKFRVEKTLKYIMNLFEKHVVQSEKINYMYIEKRIDEVIDTAKSFGELLQADLKEKGYINKDYLSATYDNGQKAIANGDAGMYVMASWVMSDISSKFPDQVNDIGTFALPYYGDGKDVLSTWSPFGVFAIKGEKQDAAQRFINYFESIPVQDKYFSAEGGIPTIIGVTKTKLTAAELDAKALLDKGLGTVNFGTGWKYSIGDVGALCQDLIAGAKTADKVLESMQKTFDEGAKAANDPNWK